jgi:hypothetical protein
MDEKSGTTEPGTECQDEQKAANEEWNKFKNNTSWNPVHIMGIPYMRAKAKLIQCHIRNNPDADPNIIKQHFHTSNSETLESSLCALQHTTEISNSMVDQKEDGKIDKWPDNDVMVRGQFQNILADVPNAPSMTATADWSLTRSNVFLFVEPTYHKNREELNRIANELKLPVSSITVFEKKQLLYEIGCETMYTQLHDFGKEMNSLFGLAPPPIPITRIKLKRKRICPTKKAPLTWNTHLSQRRGLGGTISTTATHPHSLQSRLLDPPVRMTGIMIQTETIVTGNWSPNQYSATNFYIDYSGRPMFMTHSGDHIPLPRNGPHPPHITQWLSDNDKRKLVISPIPPQQTVGPSGQYEMINVGTEEYRVMIARRIRPGCAAMMHGPFANLMNQYQYWHQYKQMWGDSLDPNSCANSRQF